MSFLRYLIFSCIFHYTVATKDVISITMDGDIILGGLFNIHQIGTNEKQCGKFNEIPAYQYMEAMLYAIDKINKRTDILPGIKLGTVIYDTCRSPTITADKTKKFIKLTFDSPNTNGWEFAGVIGPFESANSVIVANFLRVFRVPQISYGSITVKLSNKNIFNYFFRTVPPDSFFVKALVKLLQRLGWNYVSIVYSTGTWPETSAHLLKRVFSQDNICVGRFLQIKRFPNEQDFDDAIKKLVGDDQQPHMVILVTVERDSRGLLEAKTRNERGKKLNFVGSVGWSNRDDITNGLGDIADGTITFGHREKRIPEFEEYFRSLRFNNYSRNNKEWIGEYWQQTNKCRLKNFSVPSKYNKTCSGNEPNTKYKEVAPVQVVINAIEAMAIALDSMHRRLCPNTSKICSKMRPLNRTFLLEFLRNVTYEDAAFHYPVSFNANQEVDGNYTLFNFRWNGTSYDYIRVGSWVSKLSSNGSIVGTLDLQQSRVRWADRSKVVPESTCKRQCRKGEKRVIREDKCCWDCVPCEKGDIVVNDECVKCVGGFLPDKKRSSCSKLPLQYINMDTPLSAFFAFFSCLGILADVTVFSFFIAYRKNRLIKASGREMCYIIFVGIAAIFMIPLTCLAKPTAGLCYFRRFIMGMSFTICYAPLAMKTWRIYRIFKHANQFRRLSPTGLIGRRSLLLFTFGLISIQALFCALVFSTDPPNVVEKFYPGRGELVLECAFKKSAFSIYFIYNVLLLLCCTLYAFLTRHFPKNFNEAMYIGFTMYLTCVVWIVFFATFLNADYSISRVYWISGCSLVSGWVTLVGLFAPKIYQIYTKKEFTKEMLINWGDRQLSFPKVESPTENFPQCQRCKIRDSEQAQNTEHGGAGQVPLENQGDAGFANHVNAI